MNELRDATRQTISMVAWANHGPTIVSVREADTPIVVTVRVGSVLPLLSSANGQLFLAFLPPAKIKPFVQAELAAAARMSGRQGPRTVAAVEQQAADVRRRRMSRSDGTVTLGVVSLAAPVFDHRGEIACTIALVGSVGNLSLSWSGAPAKLLADAATTLSQRLGWSMPERYAIARK
jgi:DNA-binding IclR family transcriptional regulator